MALNLGTTALTALYLGSTAISTAYLGSVQVYDAGGAAFDPASLFASGEEGVWYEPSTTTCFTDLEGFTFATYGQPVAHLIDKSQGATIEARRNLLTYTEEFNNSAWRKDTGGANTITPDNETDPNGNITADTLNFADGSSRWMGYDVPITLQAGQEYTFSVWLKRNSGTGQIQLNVNPYALPWVNVTVTSEWQRFSVTQTSATTTTPDQICGILCVTAANDKIDVWGAQLDAASSASAYQKITDGQTVSWPPGNHATQTTLASRPILARVPEGGRRNFLERTEEFDNAAWIKDPPAVTVSGTTLTSTGTAFAYVRQAFNVPSGNLTLSAKVKAGTSSVVWLYHTGGAVNGNAYFDLSDETTLATAGSSQTPTNLTITDLGGGEYLVSATWVGVTGLQNSGIGFSDAKGSVSVTIGRTMDIYYMQAETGSTATAYQKVVDEYDITEAGVDSLDYLSFDGTDDVLITTSATPASNLDFFFAIDAGADAEYMLYQLEQNSGYFIFCAQDGGGGSTSSVIAGGGLFVDGVSITNNRNALHDAATGGAHIIEQQDVNLSVYTTVARIGNWALSGFALEGKLFGLIFSETLTADEITNTRAYLANRSGVTL